MTTFSLAVKAFADKAGASAELVLRKIVLDAFSSVILMSPVDTGRFRGNWQFSVGQASGVVDESVVVAVQAEIKRRVEAGEPPGDEAAVAAEISMARVQNGVASLELGTVAYLSNNLPYARRLEYGHSKQAPEGMVRVTVARYQAIVNAAVSTAEEQQTSGNET